MKNYTLIAERLLQEDKIDVEKRYATGITPIMYAAGEGNIHILKLLLNKGANVNTGLLKGSVKDFTPLHFACLKGQAESVKVLLLSGAKSNAKATNGKTPLQLLEDFLKSKHHMKKTYKDDSDIVKNAILHYDEIKQLLKGDEDEL